MRLDELSIAARRRNAWEAIDLGWMMARRWWRPLTIGYVVPSGALLLLLSLCLPTSSLWWAGLIVWWFKPVWDCVPLYIGSRLLFGEPVSPPQAWRRVPGLLRWEALFWLSLRRFSPTRSADLPLTLLEQLRGEPRRRRMGPLHLGMANGAAWLTVVCANLEIVLVSGLIGLMMLMKPVEMEVDVLGFIGGDSALPQHLFNLMSWLAMVAVAPFYAMAGFALYLNRRIELEGWDIEIRFRHLAETARKAAPAATLILLCAVALLSPASPAHADAANAAVAAETAGAAETDAAGQARTRIQTILGSEALRQTDTVYRLRLKDEPEEEKQQSRIPDWLINAIEYLEKHSPTFRSVSGWFESTAAVIEFVLWVVAISLALFLLLRYRESLRDWLPATRRAAPKTTPPATLFGWDMAQRAPAAETFAEACEHWRGGRQREAVGLLYRLALMQLLHRFAMPFQDHHTEAECLALVEQQQPQLAGAFAELIRSWQQLAYRHRALSDVQWESLRARWSEVLDGAV